MAASHYEAISMIIILLVVFGLLIHIAFLKSEINDKTFTISGLKSDKKFLETELGLLTKRNNKMMANYKKLKDALIKINHITLEPKE